MATELQQSSPKALCFNRETPPRSMRFAVGCMGSGSRGSFRNICELS